MGYHLSYLKFLKEAWFQHDKIHHRIDVINEAKNRKSSEEMHAGGSGILRVAPLIETGKRSNSSSPTAVIAPYTGRRTNSKNLSPTGLGDHPAEEKTTIELGTLNPAPGESDDNRHSISTTTTTKPIQPHHQMTSSISTSVPSSQSIPSHSSQPPQQLGKGQQQQRPHSPPSSASRDGVVASGSSSHSSSNQLPTLIPGFGTRPVSLMRDDTVLPQPLDQISVPDSDSDEDLELE